MFSFFLWWEYFKKFFYQALSKTIGGLSIKTAFLAIIKLIGKWYLIMIPPAIYVVYKLFAALESSGILKSLRDTVEDVLGSVIYIADNCFQSILDLGEMMQCITNAPSTTNTSLMFSEPLNLLTSII